MTKTAAFLPAILVSMAAAQPPPIPPLTAKVPPNARLYVQLSADRPGRMAAWREPDGTLRVVYQHRNPDSCVTDIRSTILPDVVGVPVWAQHTGQECGPSVRVDESYRRSGSMGIWTNHLGQGEGDVIGKKFFKSVTDVPEEVALLARALLAGGNRLELLPKGNAWIEDVRTLTVKARPGTEKVTEYRVNGLKPDPVTVWLDSHGELFAFSTDLIRQGWESALTELRRTR